MNPVSIVALCVSGVMLLFSILTFGRNSSKDRRIEKAEERVQTENIKESLIKANVKLDELCNTTRETRTDIKKMDNNIREMDRRMTIAEQKIEAAFREIDKLKGVKA